GDLRMLQRNRVVKDCGGATRTVREKLGKARPLRLRKKLRGKNPVARRRVHLFSGREIAPAFLPCHAERRRAELVAQARAHPSEPRAVAGRPGFRDVKENHAAMARWK